MSNTKYIQAGYTAITPYLYAKLDLVDFLKNAFDAEVTHTPATDSSEDFHGEVLIGGAHLLLGSGYFSDPSMAAAIYLYVSDADATYKRALSLGATSVREPKTESWGDRVGGVKDTSGNTWWIATSKAAG
jgi:PhnB protein